MKEYERSNEILMKGTQISGDPLFYNVMGKNYQALKQYDLAEKCFLMASNIIPNRHYPYYLLVKLHLESGDIVRAKELAEYIIQKPPKVPSGAIDEMKTEMKQILEEQ